MVDDPRWDRLTQSAKAAWRWAQAGAVARAGAGAGAGAADPSSAVPDPLDLLAGITLAHLHDSPAGQLLAHFEIPPGAVLADGGARRYSPDALLNALRSVPDDEPPGVDGQLESVVDYALNTLPPSTDGLVTLSMLCAALLETTNDASTALRRELADRGVDPEPVLRSVRDHLGRRTSFPEHLRAHHPYHRAEIQVAPYTPDEPPTRRTDVEPADLVDIQAEVDAFAYLIASRTLTPPLAVGLFGDWGSGKSYFLRSVQRRIDRLVTAEAEHPPFHRAIAQVEFNAWQYVEGNLWASLLEHLFRNLRRAGEDDDDLLDARRREYLDKITERTAEHKRAVAERAVLETRRQTAEETVRDRQGERDQRLAELEQARRRDPFTGFTPSAELTAKLAAVADETGLTVLGKHAAELRQTLTSARETIVGAGPVLGTLRTRGWRYALALVVVIAIGPVVSFVLTHLDVSAVSNAIASVSGLLAGLTAYAARGSAVLRGALGAVTEAQSQLDAELDARRAQLDADVRRAEIALAETERELASAVVEEQQLAASIVELEVGLARVTPSSVLAEFVSKRIASDDYRRHLGVPALVRQDLERLSRLIQQRHDAGAPDTGIDERHAIDRVVLYIDDLDRCPAHLVVKVLEAVHLLLSFPLFVVVVAVDARWLESSLREHYTQLGAQLGADTAVPADYLEKIFQVPFWVRPLDPSTRRRMVRGLLSPNLATSGAATAEAPDTSVTAGVPAGDMPEFVELVRSFGVTDRARQPWLEAARLTVTGDELRLLEQVTPLIGATPRAARRFVNLYLLLRAMGRGRGWALPEDGRIAVLLAIASGLPTLADAFLPTLGTSTTRTLKAVTETADPRSAVDRARLAAWLAENPDWSDLDLSDAARWVDLILRFRFHRTPTEDLLG